MKKIPGIDSHMIVKDIQDGMIKLRGLCMVQECSAIQSGERLRQNREKQLTDFPGRKKKSPVGCPENKKVINRLARKKLSINMMKKQLVC